MDDDELLERLARSLTAVNDPSEPDRGLAASAFRWRELDARLAELVLDSETTATTRSGDGSVRHYTFLADDMTIAIDVEPRTLTAQLTPPRRARLTLYGPGGVLAEGQTDDGFVNLAVSASSSLMVTIEEFDSARMVRTPWF